MLTEVVVDRTPAAIAQEIEEQYACDSAGAVAVTIRNLTANYGREYRLGRWSSKQAVVRPSVRKRARKASMP